MKTRTKIVYMIIGMILAFAIATPVFFYQIKNSNEKLENQRMTAKPWFDISDDVSKKLLSKFADIRTKKHYSSGCQISPGFFLTSLHGVTDAILDNSTISINGQKAQEVWRSPTDEDYIILTTWSEFEKGKLKFPRFNNFQDKTNVIAVGSPGDQRKIVQPAKIMNDVFDENDKVKDYSKIISMQYLDFGLSGGCVYSEDGETVLGVITGMHQNPGSTIGEITIVSGTDE